MGVTSALFTGLSGLNVNQQRLNVVGNNIANVNTTAFKASRALFTPQFYVTDAAGSAPSSDIGGSNPSQRGLGATLAAIEKDWAAGSIEATGRSTDMAINGEGFFVVKTPDGQQYTRDGSFQLNSNKDLVSTSGAFVQGYGVDATGNIATGVLRNVNIPIGRDTIAKATQSATLTGNLNSGGELATTGSVTTTQNLTTIGGTVAPTGATFLTQIASSDNNLVPLFAVGNTLTLDATRGGTTIIPPLTFDITGTSTLDDLRAFMEQGLQIDTDAALPGPAPGVTINAAGGNNVNLEITGNLGTANALAIDRLNSTNATVSSPLSFSRTANATGESFHTTVPGYDSLGNSVLLDVTAVLESKSTNAQTTWRFFVSSPNDTDASVFDPVTPSTGAVLGNGTLTFDSNGKLLTATGTTVSVSREQTGADTPMSITLDFSTVTSLTKASGLSMSSQDGFAVGTLSGFSVDENGTITGTYSNGQHRVLGQLAVATFRNPQGLIDNGGNMYSVGANSGLATIGAPGANGSGTIQGASLEGSNVDLSAEFINMIISSTGFSAASRVITTSDQLIQELLNASR